MLIKKCANTALKAVSLLVMLKPDSSIQITIFCRCLNDLCVGLPLCMGCVWVYPSLCMACVCLCPSVWSLPLCVCVIGMWLCMARLVFGD